MAKNIEDRDFPAWLDDICLQTHAAHIRAAGLRYFRHFADMIFSAAEEGGDINTVVIEARAAGVPDGLVKSILAAIRAGYDDLPGLSIRGDQSPACNLDPHHILITDEFMAAAITETDYKTSSGNHVRAGVIWTKMANYIWQGCRLVLQRDATAAETDPVVLDTGATVEDVRRAIIKAWNDDRAVIDVYCLRSGWDEPLLESDLTETASAQLKESLYA